MPRLRNVPGSREKIADSVFCVDEPERNRGQWKLLFGNDHPIRAEIGMGKGKFLMRQAALHPEINFIGIEMFSSVLVRAVERADLLAPEERRNFRFIRMDAVNLTDVFEKNEIERIYLNFSDPWPKEKHAKRRLTSSRFLRLYEQILPPRGRVEFKTDNTDLFDFSLETAAECGWTILSSTSDLYADPDPENVPTEYEEKFVAEGKKICRMIIENRNGE